MANDTHYPLTTPPPSSNPLPFEGDFELVINHVKEDVCGLFARGSDGKVVYLTFEDHMIPSYSA